MKKRQNSPDSARVEDTVKKETSRAANYARDPEKAKKLAQAAAEKAKQYEKNRGPLGEVWEYLMTLIRLLKAYAHREYTDIPWGSIVLITVAIIYFVSPIDLVPDFVPVAGYVDDAAVIAFVIAQVKADLDNFRAWEAQQEKAGA